MLRSAKIKRLKILQGLVVAIIFFMVLLFLYLI